MTRFTVSRDSPWFDGHFEGAPILPGIAHIAFAVEACATPKVLLAIRDVRFSRPVLPDDEVEVVLRGEREVRFEIRCNGKPASSGVLLFAE